MSVFIKVNFSIDDVFQLIKATYKCDVCLHKPTLVRKYLMFNVVRYSTNFITILSFFLKSHNMSRNSQVFSSRALLSVVLYYGPNGTVRVISQLYAM